MNNIFYRGFSRVFYGLERRRLLNSMPDWLYLKIRFYVVMGRYLNLKNPKSFNEKIQWLKLNDRKEIYSKLADKYGVRDYIAKKIGEEYLIPLLGVWDDADEIKFDLMPDKYVLKTTHDGGVLLCDKSKGIDRNKIVSIIKSKMARNYYYMGREWCYKNITPKIIAEQWLDDDIIDYKFMVFNGKVKCIFTCSERNSDGLKVTFFDKDWNMLPFERTYPSSKKEIPKPQCLSKMIEIAETLAMGIPFIRVDMYYVMGKLYIGEMTFYPGGGMEAFQPQEWDYTLGEWLRLD